ncbi:MAG: phosphonate C-P lyase system protein PhnL, partial [Coriobacteriales bacterium]
MPRPMLEIDDLSKSFTLHAAHRHVQGCQHVTLHVDHGEFVGITGRSGSGKSTILKCLYRTNLPESGAIWYDSAAFGRVDLARIDERRMVYLRDNEIGYVSQFLDVVPRTTAHDIVWQSAAEAFADEDDIESETVRMLRHFDFPAELWDLYPNTFSGGEKLRLNIARAMVRRPRLLLLDEPTASLDNANKLKVRALIEQLKASGTTMLGIFHDLEFMEGVCDREYNMQLGGFVAEGGSDACREERPPADTRGPAAAPGCCQLELGGTCPAAEKGEPCYAITGKCSCGPDAV